MAAKKKTTTNSGRIPVFPRELLDKAKKNLEKNRTFGGIGSTKAEADKIARDLKKKGWQTLVSKAAENVWLVEKSKINFNELEL
jgi:hypothetical protein